MRRTFSGRERIALFLAAGGKCAICRRPLGIGWHADHMEPWSYGGVTDVVNGQALCADCNLKKGDRMKEQEWRTWQLDFLERYESAGQKDFLCEAMPGAGKTKPACEIAARALRTGRARRIFVVVPTERLKVQWQRALDSFGLQSRAEWAAADGDPFQSGEFNALIITYGAVASSPDSFRRMAGQTAALAIFDEIHHCGYPKAWAGALRHAFELAHWRLALSGTPFRDDTCQIPFVRYVDGQSISDFVYGYDQALADGIVRSVSFPQQGGTAEWVDLEDGEVVSATFDDDLRENEARRRLRTAVTTEGWLSEAIKQANRQLIDLREDDPTASGLVVCPEIRHAKLVAELMARQRIASVLVTSEDPEAQDKLEDFSTSAADPWLISVKMVCEGVDIPKLRVGIYADIRLTAMAFRQFVGRFLRGIDTAYVYIPDDPVLRRHAQEIRMQRVHVLEQEIERHGREGIEKAESTNLYQPLRSTGEPVGLIHDGIDYSAAEWAHAERARQSDAAFARISTAMIVRLLRWNRELPTPPSPAPPKLEEPLEKRHAKLRADNQKLSQAISMRWGLEFAEVHVALNRAVGIRKVPLATTAELERRLGLAMGWYRNGSL